MPVLINRPTSIRPYQPVPQDTHGECAACGGCGCSACGGLECLCRPRFFAGQLLTDEDLNRLDRYMVGKGRLHNRYLHGWGVVCGLEVLCHPCDGYVTVTAGYALSPCGDDIVVCEDDAVNVCDLLQKCRDDSSQDCQPLRPYGNQRDCKELGEEWILVICYEERATRGVMPLRNPKQSGGCNRCNCGGSQPKNGQSCGCGCHEKSSAKAASHKTASRKTVNPMPAQCEATATCESYRFELRPAATLRKRDIASKAPRPALVERAAFVMEELRASVPPPPLQSAAVLWRNWNIDVAGVYMDAIRRYGGYTCNISDDFTKYPYPDRQSYGSDAEYVSAVSENVQRLTAITASYLQPLICAALLPPCPPPAKDNCVPLAKLRIDRTTCRVREICNVDVRKLVITFPLLQYWLGAFTGGANLEAILERLCCTPQRTDYVRVKGFTRTPAQPVTDQPIGVRPPLTEQPTVRAARSASTDSGFASAGSATSGGGKVPAPAPGGDFDSTTASNSPLLGLFSHAARRGSAPVNTYMLLLDALGAVDDRDRSLLSSLERTNPVESLLLNQVVLPVLKSFAPQGVDVSDAIPTIDTNSELRQLRAMMEQQQKTIMALQQEVENLRSDRRA